MDAQSDPQAPTRTDGNVLPIQSGHQHTGESMNEAQYFHSRAGNCQVVRCMECGDPMDSVYDPAIRDKCSPCGGVSKIAESREQDRRRLNLPRRISRSRGEVQEIPLN